MLVQIACGHEQSLVSTQGTPLSSHQKSLARHLCMDSRVWPRHLQASEETASSRELKCGLYHEA